MAIYFPIPNEASQRTKNHPGGSKNKRPFCRNPYSKDPSSLGAMLAPVPWERSALLPSLASATWNVAV